MELPFNTVTSSPNETERVGGEIARALLEEPSLPRFIAMFGDLGVGKTAFTRGFTREISPSAKVKSPTFALVNEYPSPTLPVYHFDMYRITSEDDLFSIGFDDYIESRGVCVVEWSENILFALPESYIKVTIEKTGEDTPDQRRLSVELI